MSATEVKIQRWPHSENVRMYHVRCELTEKSCEFTYRGDKGSALSELILKIPGITNCEMNPYRLSISKSPAFGWDEIEPAVLEILNALQTMPGEGEVL